MYIILEITIFKSLNFGGTCITLDIRFGNHALRLRRAHVALTTRYAFSFLRYSLGLNEIYVWFLLHTNKI